jgi:hypothetical protein
MAMAPRARSTTEMRFFVSLQTCSRCGTPIDPEWLGLWGGGRAWALTGDCGHCRTPLAFTFVTHGNPMTAPVRRGELGGPEHSEVIPVGAIFVRCKMNGLAGHPSTVESVAVDDPDLSVGGDRSLIGTAADVLEMWR